MMFTIRKSNKLIRQNFPLPKIFALHCKKQRVHTTGQGVRGVLFGTLGVLITPIIVWLTLDLQCQILHHVFSICRGVSNEWNFVDAFRNLVLKFEIPLWNLKFTLKCEIWLKPIMKPSLISRSVWPVMPYTYSFLQI